MIFALREEEKRGKIGKEACICPAKEERVKPREGKRGNTELTCNLWQGGIVY